MRNLLRMAALSGAGLVLSAGLVVSSAANALPASASTCLTQPSYAYSVPNPIVGPGDDFYELNVIVNSSGCAASGFTATFTPFAVGTPASCSGVTGANDQASCLVDVPVPTGSYGYAWPYSGGYLVDVVFYADFGSATGTCNLGITYSESSCPIAWS